MTHISLDRGDTKQKIGWTIKPGASDKVQHLRKRVSLVALALLIFYFFCKLHSFSYFERHSTLGPAMIVWLISNIFSLQIPSLPSLPSLSRGRPRPNYEGGVCPDPTSVFDAWNIHAFVPGLDDNPVPLEYSLKDRKAHKLSIVDIDAKDTRMEIYVDGINKGLTTEFQLDKTLDCGDNLGLCLQQGFSAGVVVVPPGKHTVRIHWVGEGQLVHRIAAHTLEGLIGFPADFINDTKRIDWGEKRERRVMWQREYCA